jgi:hypothetical protein
MTLAEQMIADSAIFFNLAEHGETITYNGVEIQAVVEPGVSLTRGNAFETMEGTSSSGVAWIRMDDVESPTTGDSVVLGNGTRWEVVRILATNGGVHQLEIMGSENPWGSANSRQVRAV